MDYNGKRINVRFKQSGKSVWVRSIALNNQNLAYLVIEYNEVGSHNQDIIYYSLKSLLKAYPTKSEKILSNLV